MTDQTIFDAIRRDREAGKILDILEEIALAAEELATVCAALIDHERPETEAVRALAAFRKAAGGE